MKLETNFKVDMAIFDHFNSTLWKDLSVLGFEKVASEVSLFRYHLENTGALCTNQLREADRKFCAEMELTDAQIFDELDIN